MEPAKRSNKQLDKCTPVRMIKLQEKSNRQQVENTSMTMMKPAKKVGESTPMRMEKDAKEV